MTQDIISYLNTKLAGSNYFSTIYELCNKVAKGDHAEPMQYCSNGELKAIDLDFTNGTAYWRRDSATNVSSAEPDLTSCENMVVITENLLLIAYVPKSKLSKDDTYSDDRVAYGMMKLLTSKSPALKNALGAKNAVVLVSGFETDREKVMEQEYSNPGRRIIKYENAYISLKVQVVITVKTSCLPDPCPEMY